MQEGQNRKTPSLSIFAIVGVEPHQEKSGEEYMNEAQLAHFRCTPEARCNQLRDEVDRTVTHMQDEVANFPDPVDHAVQEEEFSLELRNHNRERKPIKKIEKTLKKVEDKDSGYCEPCGVEVGIRRLEARPTADLCTDCKALAEIREKQMAGWLQPFHRVYHRREILPPHFLLREMTDTHHIGRLASSPSGELHFGSLIAALGSYLQARARQGRWPVRIEDIDLPCEVLGAVEIILRQLGHYGLYWDGDVLWQSQRHHVYHEAPVWLHKQGLSYHCTCMRAHIQSIGGIYDGHCRDLHHGSDNAAARIRQQHPVIQFTDLLRGIIHADEKLAREDFIIHRRGGLFAYNLAVVVGDHLQGVSEVAREADLIEPTVRQISLYQLLDWKMSDYTHSPLALNPQGVRLSKQNHAPALPKGDPRPVLIAALHFLGQQVEAHW